MTDNDMRHKRGHIYCQTLGCKVNAYETALIKKKFEQEGFILVSEPQIADIYVINTCTVTAEADRKTRQMIRRARKIAPQAIVAAMGCQIQADPENNDADIIVGTQNRHVLVQKAIKAFEQKSLDDKHRSMDLSFDHNSCNYEDYGSVFAQEGTRAYIKIQDGCDRFCSYCIIPYMRGGSRSRKMSSILSEAQSLSEKGYKEVVITGINICAYGKDLNTDEDLSDVVQNIARIEGIRRIRLGSLEPIYMSDEIIEKLANVEKLAPHFHLSLQSGSDRILKAMNRQYDTAAFLHIVHQIKAFFEHAAITTDVIVGFPGETQEDYLESIIFCEKAAFLKIHVFPFSPRKGTRAASLSDRVDKHIIKTRCDAFLELSNTLFFQSAIGKIGDTCHVLVETRNMDGSFSGYSEDYFRVHISNAEMTDIGNFVEVRITGASIEELSGTRIRN